MTPIAVPVSRSNDYSGYDYFDKEFQGGVNFMGSMFPGQEHLGKSSELDPAPEEFADVTVGAGSKRRKSPTSESPPVDVEERSPDIHMDSFEAFDNQDGSYFQGAKRRRRSSDQVQQGYKWSREEEAFLVGAIMQRFFSYGSLTSSRRSDEDNVWEYIKTVFDERREKYALAIGKLPPRERTQNALQRHWKLMKSSSNRSFYALYKLWEKLYGDACGSVHG